MLHCKVMVISEACDCDSGVMTMKTLLHYCFWALKYIFMRTLASPAVVDLE